MEKNKYYEGIFFHETRTHDKDGTPTKYLFDKDAKKRLYCDATLYFPTKKGIVIGSYEKGEIKGYCYLIIKDNKIQEVNKKPYGILRNIPNKATVYEGSWKNILHLIGKGNETWFTWKAMINSKDITRSKDYTFNTLTVKQDRIPNAGMRIYNA